MNVIDHYDQLIEENNDPFRDSPLLQEYMSKWDGQIFLDSMCLSPEKKVLEIGIGTGRIAAKAAPYCLKLTGIDISPKTIERAKENLSHFDNLELICSDFSNHAFTETFDIIYSSLTLMHFKDKQHFISKVDSLLNIGGTFCLSLNKNQNDSIDMGTRKLIIYPDKLDTIITLISLSTMKIVTQYETEFAHIIVCSK
ncbi:MAG: class I SAM-dependent methyltransferase [Lachnospiraceae bacterium]|nr:class I SAM-dependent methyltransferase [Lachnospiraceae bacterium]